MKIIMMGLMAVCLVGAGAGGGYMFTKKEANASLTPASEEAKVKQKVTYKSAKEAAKHIRFVEMDPIILPIIDSSGVSQVVTIIVSLEVNGDDNAKLAETLSPRLKDAYIQDMYGVLNRRANLRGGVIKVEHLKKRLNRVSDNILGQDKVNDVLLQVVNQRPI